MGVDVFRRSPGACTRPRAGDSESSTKTSRFPDVDATKPRPPWPWRRALPPCHDNAACSAVYAIGDGNLEVSARCAKLSGIAARERQHLAGTAIPDECHAARLPVPA